MNGKKWGLVSRGLFDFLEVTQRPALVEIALCWFIESEVGEPALARDGWDSVGSAKKSCARRIGARSAAIAKVSVSLLKSVFMAAEQQLFHSAVDAALIGTT
jgi:hypothetical protein